MKIALDIIPDEIIFQYNLHAMSPNGWVYMEIRKVLLGLKYACHIENDRLYLNLSNFGYAPVARTPSLWKHTTKNIIFSLVVDNFGVKYVGKENADNMIQALKKLYNIYIYWDGSL